MPHPAAPHPVVLHLVVDAANVVGSRPDGWWRDRAGAASRLLTRITAALDEGRLDGLCGGGSPGSDDTGDAAAHDGGHARRDGPVGASHAITVPVDGTAPVDVTAPADVTAPVDGGGRGGVRVHVVLEGAAKGADVPQHPGLEVVLAPGEGDDAIVACAAALDGPVTVVTADRELRERVRAVGADLIGPGGLWAALDG